MRIVTALEQALRGGPCVPFIAPTDVVLSLYTPMSLWSAKRTRSHPPTSRDLPTL